MSIPFEGSIKDNLFSFKAREEVLPFLYRFLPRPFNLVTVFYGDKSFVLARQEDGYVLQEEYSDENYGPEMTFDDLDILLFVEFPDTDKIRVLVPVNG